MVEGSHRVIRRFLEDHPRAALAKMKNVRLALCASDPWLKALNCGSRPRLMRVQRVQAS